MECRQGIPETGGGLYQCPCQWPSTWSITAESRWLARLRKDGNCRTHKLCTASITPNWDGNRSLATCQNVVLELSSRKYSKVSMRAAHPCDFGQNGKLPRSSSSWTSHSSRDTFLSFAQSWRVDLSRSYHFSPFPEKFGRNKQRLSRCIGDPPLRQPLTSNGLLLPDGLPPHGRSRIHCYWSLLLASAREREQKELILL